MKKTLYLLLLLIPLLHMGACYYDAEDELYPEVVCDTTAVTYSGIVLPIIQQSCYTCHSEAANQGGVNIEGYPQIKAFVDNGLLLGAIKHQSGFSPMPKNSPKMPDCEILQIETWIDQGAQNN